MNKFLQGTFLLVFISVFIRIVIGEPCLVPTGSMEPTLLGGDRLWINKLAYGGRLPERWADVPLLNIFTWIRPLRVADRQNRWGYRRLPGYTSPKVNDIVVFNSPTDSHLLLVKRVTQVVSEGDTLVLNRRTYSFYRSLILHEGNNIMESNGVIYVNGKRESVYVPKHTFYFMEGDNRINSHDSRHFGFISEDKIVGKFDFILFSIDSGCVGMKSIRWERFFRWLGGGDC